MATHIYTSIIANYIPKARVLAHSVKKRHPEAIFHLFISDALPTGLDLASEPFDRIWTIEDLGLENAEQWVFEHTIVEASTGIKGFALLKLLELPGCTEVLYFDPDIVVLRRLDGLLKHFHASSILLTPHLTAPEKTLGAILDNEFSVLKHGIYNLGFVGVKNSSEGQQFARWWASRLQYFCFDDIPAGLFTDQRWVDLAPAFFPGCAILHYPGYNVCTWNLTHRTVEGSLEAGLTANGQPVVFYHFSGIDSGAQEAMLGRYGSQMPALRELREWYLTECERMGQTAMSRIPWIYGKFDNGAAITNAHRTRYRERADLRESYPQPFAATEPSESFYHWFEANDESRKPARAWKF
ncbi:MAG TPA: hypothetical protein VGJ09_20380 [Bryobacteraceae bacterium]